MPQYLASRHAVERVRERFPDLAALWEPSDPLAPRRWLARLARRGRPAGEQFGRDLLLRCLVAVGWRTVECYLPVTPLSRDRWLILTVLDAEQAAHNLADRERRLREAWRRRKGFDRRRRRRCPPTRPESSAACGHSARVRVRRAPRLQASERTSTAQ